MPRPSSRYIEELAKEWEPKLRDSFIAAVRRITNSVSIAKLAERISQRDIEGALRLVGVDPSDFSQVTLDLARAYAEGGLQASQRIPVGIDPEGYRVRFVFDVRNHVAERILAEQAGALVQGLVDSQHVAMRANLVRGLERGQNPVASARELAGYVQRQDLRINGVLVARAGERFGGIIGLAANQEKYVASYVADLASTDPGTLRKLISDATRGLRNRTFDRSVLKAIKEGRGIPAETQKKMATAYRSNALFWRAKNIARTETLRALGSAQTESFRQGIDKGVITRAQIKRFWITAGDERVRHTHRLIPGLNKGGVGWDEPFQTPTGPVMHAPHDTDPQCRCRERIDIDYLAPAVRALRAAQREGGA